MRFFLYRTSHEFDHLLCLILRVPATWLAKIMSVWPRQKNIRDKPDHHGSWLGRQARSSFFLLCRLLAPTSRLAINRLSIDSGDYTGVPCCSDASSPFLIHGAALTGRCSVCYVLTLNWQDDERPLVLLKQKEALRIPQLSNPSSVATRAISTPKAIPN